MDQFSHYWQPDIVSYIYWAGVESKQEGSEFKI